MKSVFITVGSIALVVLTYVLSVYLFVFGPSFSRAEMTEEKIKKYFMTEEFYSQYLSEKSWFESKNPRHEYVVSHDGLKLAALVLPFDKNDSQEIEESLGTVILLHGYHSDPVREFVSLAHFYHNLGYNVIMPYQRSHGESEGEYITFGLKERFDIRDWMFKANELFGSGKPLFVEGISMGCATTVMSLGFDNLPANLRGIIADCGFTSPKAIIMKVLSKDKKIPTSSLIFTVGNAMSQSKIGVDLEEYSTFDAIDFNKTRAEQIPILFIHGADDDYVPLYMTSENFMRCVGNFSELEGGDLGNVVVTPNPQASKYKYVQIEGAQHAISNIINPEKYHSEVRKFLEKYGK